MANVKFYCRPATQAETELTAGALLDHSSDSLGLKVEYESFAILAYEETVLIGSIIGKIFLDWLHIDLVWVSPLHRRKGLGREMMLKMQDYATEYGVSGIEIWTQSWQAPDFYRKMGYNEFAVFDDFLPGKKRHAFRYYLHAELKPVEKTVTVLSLPEVIHASVEEYFRMHGETLPCAGIYNRLLPLFEKPLLEVTLAATSGNQIKAASLLGINRNTLRKKIAELGIAL